MLVERSKTVRQCDSTEEVNRSNVSYCVFAIPMYTWYSVRDLPEYPYWLLLNVNVPLLPTSVVVTSFICLHRAEKCVSMAEV